MEYTLYKAQVKDKEIVYRLLQYSLFEESSTDLNEMNDQALYDYPNFDDYFIKDNYIAYIIKEKETNKILGLAMIYLKCILDLL